MIKKIFVAFGSLLCISTLFFATDLLAFYTNGKLTENSPGVRVLSLEEKKSVRGGYVVHFYNNQNTELFAVARVTINGDAAGVNFGKIAGDEIIYNADGTFNPSKSGLCGIDTKSCFQYPDLQQPFWQNQKRLQELQSIVGDPVLYSLGYSVKRNIGISSLGNKFVYFTYGTVIFDNSRGTFYRLNSSAILNNNIIIKEIANKYKEAMEYTLGGWTVKSVNNLRK